MSDQHENVLPPAVRKQVDQANAIIEQLNSGVPPQDPPPADPPQDPDNHPGAMPTKPEKKDPPPAPPKPDNQPPADPPQDPAPEGGQRTDWKQKYNVLKGKYDAEVPRLHADLREANTHIRQMGEQLNTLTATVSSLKEVQQKPATPPPPAVTPEEVEQFGPDLIDVIERKAREVADRIVADRVGKVEQTVTQVQEGVANTNKSMAKSARERLYERLDEKVPGWDTINRSGPFVAWLNEEDGLSGQLRGVILRNAFERNDAERVVKIFQSFQRENAVGNSDPGSDAPNGDESQQDPQGQQQPEKPPESQQNLDDLVAPGTPKTGTTGAQEGSGKGRIWTQNDISEFYAQKNEWVKKRPNDDLPKEMQALERDLIKAQGEGRIRA